jgi:hypothetical protein
MSIHRQSRQQLARTAATVTAAGVVAYVALVHGDALISAQSGARPVVAVPSETSQSASATPTPKDTSPYDPMQDYVDQLIWWKAHPDWMPDGICS